MIDVRKNNTTAGATGGVAILQAGARGFAKSIGQLATNVPLRFSLLAVLILQLCVIVAFRPSYATNDDVFMTMIASGKGLCPAPDQHLIFTNVIIGTALKQLYTAFPQIPWYGCYLLLVHLLAQVALLYCALTIGRRLSATPIDSRPAAINIGLRCGLYLLYYALVELPLLNRLQFTTTAFVAAQAGIFLWLLAWQRRTQQKDAAVIGPLCAAVSLLFISGIIRWESLAMAALVATPVALLFIYRFSRPAIAPCGIAFVTAAVLVASAITFDHWTYEHDPAWRGFRQLNQTRGKFHDGHWTAYTPETAGLFAEVGWSENDHAMIASWFSDDPVLYSEANLKKIVDSHPWSSARQTVDLWWQAFRDIARNRSVLSVLLVLPFVVVIIPGRRAKWAIGGSVLAALALVAVVNINQKLPPERVYFPLLSFPLSVALLSFAWRSGTASAVDSPSAQHKSFFKSVQFPFIGQRAWPRNWVVASLLIAAIVMGFYRQVRMSGRVQRQRVVLQNFLKEQQSADHKLLVSWESALPFELTSPLDNLSSWSRIPLISLVWTQRTPWHEEIKRQFGITNLALALCERDDIVLVATPLHRAQLTTFAKEHFGADITFVPSPQAGGTFVAGRFQREPTRENTATRQIDAAYRK